MVSLKKEESAKKESFQDIMSMSLALLKDEVVQGTRALFNFRMQTDGSIKPHVIRNTKKRIARLKTAVSLKELEKIKGE